MARARLQDVLSATYLDDLEHRPIEEIRALRAECQQLEVDQSYLRRLIQGRFDIVRSEQARRVGGAGPSDVSDIVEHLPEILADRVHAPGVGRLPTYLSPSEDADLTSELDALFRSLGSIDGLSDREIDGLATALSDLEHTVSARRRALHERIDALQSELTRRYKTGEATVDSLLQ